MITKLTFFDGPQDLEKLTGLTHDELWDHDFNLDDMDFGFVFDDPNVLQMSMYKDDWGDECEEIDSDESDALHWLLFQAECHCVGYTHTEYKGKHYFTVHHA